MQRVEIHCVDVNIDSIEIKTNNEILFALACRE
jgi:hypothetical protein